MSLENVNDTLFRKRSAGVTQLVECDLAKVDVAGSNPVSRSSPFNPETITKHVGQVVNLQPIVNRPFSRLSICGADPLVRCRRPRRPVPARTNLISFGEEWDRGDPR
jgi:hypothetical protein